MAWKVVERSLIPEDFQRGTEDGDFVTDHAVFLGDGVSDSSGEIIEGLTPGQFAIRSAIHALADFVGGPEDLAPFLTKTLARAIRAVNRPDPCGRPSYVFVVFFPRHSMIVRVGDCQYLIDGKGYNPGLMVDQIKSMIRSKAIMGMLDAVDDLPKRSLLTRGILEHDPTLLLMREMTKHWQPSYANNPDPICGYGVINGKRVPPSQIEYVRVSKDVREIILTSDGYPIQAVRGTLKKTETAMRAILVRDPLCIEEWPSVRGLQPGCDRIDDSAYIRLIRE